MVVVAYGVGIDSDISLGLLESRPERESEPTAPHLTIRELSHPVTSADIALFESDDDGPWSGGVVGDHFYLRFGDEAEFIIDQNGANVAWYSFGDRSATLVHLLLDHVVPHALKRRGRLVIHGSCLVATTGHCFTLVGQSGWGKSTLAASLSARGHQFLADDCTVIECGQQPLVAAAYPGLRLHEKSIEIAGLHEAERAGSVSDYSSKQRFNSYTGPSWPGTERFRLRAILIIKPPGEGDSTELRTIGKAEATIALLGHSFHLNRPSERVELLDRVASTVDACAIAELPYEQSRAGLERAISQIQSFVAGVEGVER